MVQEKMLAEMKSTLLDSMRAGTFETSRGEGNAAVTFRLAQEYGMCWGAERSIELALAATEKYPDKRKHITNELLHNPGVNNMLADAGVEFVDKTADGGKRFDETPRGGVLDFFEAVYRMEDEALYAPEIKPGKKGNLPTYKEWRTYQMSDHLLLWSAFKVDFASDYLEDLAKPPS